MKKILFPLKLCNDFFFFFERKGMWNYGDGTSSVKPTDKKDGAKYEKESKTLDVNNSNIPT